MGTFLGIHYVNGVLEATGWPKRKSLFNSTAVVDSLILDMTIGQMIDWAASIGACRPKLALQILATMFSKVDWGKVGLFDIIKIDDARQVWNYCGNKNPRKIVNPKQFSKYGESTEASLLNDKKTLSLLENYCMESLFWGLNNPDKFLDYFNSERENQIDRLEEYKKAGLEVNSIPTIEEFLNDGEKIISSYEEKMARPLLPIPRRLIDDMLQLGLCPSVVDTNSNVPTLDSKNSSAYLDRENMTDTEAEKIFEAWRAFMEVFFKFRAILLPIPPSFYPYPPEKLLQGLDIMERKFADAGDNETANHIQITSSCLLPFLKDDEEALELMRKNLNMALERPDLKNTLLEKLHSERDQWLKLRNEGKIGNYSA